MTRLLVVRLGSFGDLVHTLPAVAALRRARPADLEIDWLVDAPHAGFLSLVEGLTRVVPLPGRTMRAWLATRRVLRARGYEVAADFQGLIKSAALARFSGAARVLGFDRPSLREPAAALFYTERVTVGEAGHVIHKNLRLAASLGAQPGPLEFPIAQVASPVAEAARVEAGGPYALVNPGAAWPNKRWPPDRLGAIARRLRDRHGLASLVLWGPGERDAAMRVAAESGGAAHVVPEAGWPDVLALSRGARLILSGDTGPLHLAAAVGVPAVALFGPTNPRRNGPWADADISISRYDQCQCHYQRRCRRDAARWCLGTIDVDEVAEAIDRRLQAASGARA
jgi:lipopolysaccharide heptosyltransferase I